MNHKAFALAIAIAGMIASAVPSYAYRMIQQTGVGRFTSGAAVSCTAPGGFVHWNISNIAWRLNTANQGSGKSTAVSKAMASWTSVAGGGHFLMYAGTTTGGWATDGINTMLWASGNGCTGSCLALTALVLQPGQVIVETDITFNNSVTWTTNGNTYDTEAVAAHELGHTLGIHHSEAISAQPPTMHATYFGSGGRSLEADDEAALRCAASL